MVLDFLLPNGEWGENVIIFGVDNSSLALGNNIKKYLK